MVSGASRHSDKVRTGTIFCQSRYRVLSTIDNTGTSMGVGRNHRPCLALIMGPERAAVTTLEVYPFAGIDRRIDGEVDHD
jgi:hypothetical protein